MNKKASESKGIENRLKDHPRIKAYWNPKTKGDTKEHRLLHPIARIYMEENHIGGNFVRYEAPVKCKGGITKYLDILFEDAIVEVQVGKIDWKHVWKTCNHYHNQYSNLPIYIFGENGITDDALDMIERFPELEIHLCEMNFIDRQFDEVFDDPDPDRYVIDLDDAKKVIEVKKIKKIERTDDSKIEEEVAILHKNLTYFPNNEIIEHMYDSIKYQLPEVRDRTLEKNIDYAYDKKVFEGESCRIPEEHIKKEVKKIKDNYADKSPILIAFSIEYLHHFINNGFDMSGITLIVESNDDGRIKYAKQFGISNFVTRSEIMTQEINMNKKPYNEVIGNPPYQYGKEDKKDTGSKLYMDFTEKMLQLADNVRLITPSKILEKDETSSIGKAFKDTLCEVDFRADEYFNIGQNVISWYCSNEKDNDKIKVIRTDGTVKIVTDINDVEDKGHNVLGSLIKKLSYKSKRYDKFTDNLGVPISNKAYKMPIKQASNKDAVDNKMLNKTPSSTHTIPVRCNTKKSPVRYCTQKDAVHNGANRVIIPYAGRYDDGAVISDEEINQLYFINDIDLTYDQMNNLISIMNSKLYSVVIGMYSSTEWKKPEPAHNFLFRVVKPGINALEQSWTDEELYEYFNLSDEEINYVEEKSKTCSRYIGGNN